MTQETNVLKFLARYPEYQPTGMALDVFNARYPLVPGETYHDAMVRVATHVARAEQGELIAQYTNAMTGMLLRNLFFPGGRIVAGAGRVKGQLSNCFLIPTGDSREGWGKSASDMIVISGTGGGVGLNLSPIRPRGTAIAGTGGTATGAVSLGHILNAAGDVIKAGGGRRVALKFDLEHDHGDIIEFLNEKLNANHLNNANISVAFAKNPEVFFDKVRNDETYDLLHQGKVVGKLSAREVWNNLVRNAMKNGEPGLQNLHYINKMSNVGYCAKMLGTNPCQPAWATLLTPQGIRTMGECQVGDTIWSGQRWTKIVAKQATGVKPVYAYRTSAGTFNGTQTHRVVSGGEKKEVRHAGKIDVNVGPKPQVRWLDCDVMDGLVFGDGMVHKASNNRVVLLIGRRDQSYFDSEIKHLITCHRPGIKHEAYEVTTTLTADELPRTYNRVVPDRFVFGSPSTVAGFLRGLFSANGSVVSGRVTLKSSSIKVVRQVQGMLSSLGIMSYYTTNQIHETKFANGAYICRESYDLNISTDRFVFGDIIGFLQPYKMDKLVSSGSISSRRRQSSTIKSSELVSEEMVYDITVDAEEHTYWTDGLLVSNCGEITLSAYESCCLGSLVLPRFAASGQMDWDSLHQCVALGVRFLDNVISTNTFPLPEIQKACTDLRRIGLGVTGLHDMLLLCGLQYNSAEGLEFVDKVMGRIKNWAYEASSDLAAEKGSFPLFDPDQFLRGGFARTLKPSIREKISRQGIRNCALLTVAPVGTGSIVCDTSSGIEPLFAPAYRRRFRLGDEWHEEVVVHPLFKRFMDEGKSVAHFQGAHELSVRDHLEMQRTVQRHVDNSISKTINIPQGSSESELSSLLMEYFPELKGVTVYPDGSRENQPLTPLPLDEAELAYRLDKYSSGASGQSSCKNGVCEL